MKYLGILTSARTAPEFIGTEPVQRATWLCLMLFCAEHETGGVIVGCKSWGNRRWMQTCGVTKEEVMVDSTLFHYLGDDLTVWGYQDEYEASILARREAGRRAGLRSAEVRSNQKLKPQVEPQVEPTLEPQVEPTLEPQVEREVQRKDRIGEDRIGEEAPSGAIAGAGEGSPDANPPRPMAELRAMAETVGLEDFDGWLAYWTANNWIAAYGGLEHRMLPREVHKSMVNWKSKAKEIEHADGKRQINRGGATRRPATFHRSNPGDYTAEKCGF